MHNIEPINPAAAPKPVEPANPVSDAKPTTEPAQIRDTVEISTIAKLAAKVQEIPDVRTDLVQKVKAEIAAGKYETPEKIEAAIDKLMEELM